MAEDSTRRARVERLLAATRQVADAGASAGQALRQRLLETSGLSSAGIELGLKRSLETNPSSAELEALLGGTPEAPHAHVLLSGNVFVAALRAIAIGVACSERVAVRASRRDPALAEALHALEPELFELVSALEPSAGHHVWSYGSDETLAAVRATLPAGVWLHGHGHGLGAVVLAPAPGFALAEVTSAIALDTVLFDQQGCLSPRVVCVVGTEQQARQIAEALAGALTLLTHQVPPGARSSAELGQARLARDAASYAFETFEAGHGWVSLAPAAELTFPATARCLHVARTDDPILALTPFASHISCLGTLVGEALAADLAQAFPGARSVAPGRMQRPPLDGPVDLRHGTRGELLG